MATEPIKPQAVGTPVAEAIKNAEALEARTVPGAFTREPKQHMLNSAAKVAEKHPNLRLRWVNIRDPQKAEARLQDGYRRLSPEEGGRQIGDELALMGAPREIIESKEAAIRQLNEDRLVAHRHEMERAVEGVARQLRDRHGIRVDTKRLLVNEE